MIVYNLVHTHSGIMAEDDTVSINHICALNSRTNTQQMLECVHTHMHSLLNSELHAVKCAILCLSGFQFHYWILIILPILDTKSTVLVLIGLSLIGWPSLVSIFTRMQKGVIVNIAFTSTSINTANISLGQLVMARLFNTRS